MTFTNIKYPRLSLRRLVIFRSGQSVYDESFHAGVNIIHGENGSGKSTLLDFIFFVLGGEVDQWKEYAALCESVVAEVLLNDSIVTLRRLVSPEHQRPLQIYFGTYSAASSSQDLGWQTFPFRRTGTKQSFSQILFSGLKLPEAQTAEGNNITMHQILRLLYADQMSPVQRIFRFEAFDPPIMKQAVGDLLSGVGGTELFELQSSLKNLDREFSAVNSEVRSMIALLAGAETPLNRAGLEAAIDELTRERKTLYADLEATLAEAFVSKSDRKEGESERRRSFEEMISIRSHIQELEREKTTIEFEIEDSARFISYLGETLSNLEISSLTYQELGGIKFEYCPACFSSIIEVVGHEQCHLCKSPLHEVDRSARTLAVKLDVEMQIRESTQLQSARIGALEATNRQLRLRRREYEAKSAAYDAISRAPSDTRDALIGRINQRIGFIASSIAGLHEKLEMAQKFDALSSEKSRLNDEISRLKDKIATINAAQERRRTQAYSQIASFALQLLKRDTGVQKDFELATNFTFSFADDAMFVDGKANFAASSLVVLKNSFHFALLQASLRDPQFLLPRFMMFDNIEDKGMVQERSWHFQETICSLSENDNTDHQVIFTTSKLAPSLKHSNYVVGHEYLRSSRTLNIA